MKFSMKLVLVAAVVVLMNTGSNEALRVLNKDVLQRGAAVKFPQLPLVINQIVETTIVRSPSAGPNEGATFISSSSTGKGLHDVSDGGIYIPSIIRQRLQKGPVPSGGNKGTNKP